MSKQQIRGILVTSGLHLPEADSALTKSKLESIIRFELVAPPAPVELLRFRSNIRKKSIVDAIVETAKLDYPFWFERGALPNRNYLLQTLHILDPSHPILQRSLPPSHIIRNQPCAIDCLKCLRASKRARKVKAVGEPQATQASRTIVPMLEAEEDLDYAQRLLKSRYHLVALRQGTTAVTLNESQFFDANYQYALLARINHIDRLVDKIQDLRLGNFI